MTTNLEHNETFGELIDELDNLSHALNLPIPDSMHVQCLKSSLPDLVTRLKEVYEAMTGENPWN